jgi:tRNA (cytidine/uridine-2'-O-)-methyltransferase
MSTITLFLNNLQSPINIGMALRVAETYQTPVMAYDPTGVLADAGKAKTISDFACGAMQRCGLSVIDDPAKVFARGVRVVATTIEARSIALPDFVFQPGDVVAIGNEYDGLPDVFSARAGAALRIPMAEVYTPKPASHTPIDPGRSAPVARDGRPNLNAAMSAGIIVYSAWLALDASARP